MSETIAAPAPAAASSPAPAAPAPTSAPAAAPVSTPAAAPQQTWGSGGVTTTVDPNKFPVKEDYARELLKEKLAAIPTEEAAVAVEEPVAAPAVELPTEQPEVQAPDAVTEAPAETAEEPDFQLEPEAIVTPELLSQMVTDNPEFGKLLEADPRLKGQLYKTAREAAELQPYREIFPDIESAKSAVANATTFNDVRETFKGSTTRDGALKTLARIEELCYELDDQGNVVMQDGKPVTGDDFFGLVDTIEQLALEHHKKTVQDRLNDQNGYFAGGKTQEEAQAAFTADQNRMAMIDELLGQVVEAPEELPAYLKEKAADIDRREKALKERQQGEKVEERRSFESGLQTEAQTRINDGIGKIIANVEKQGGVVSPYLKNILPKAIGAKVIQKIQANPALQDQMHMLQRLPIGDASRQRRLAAIDRAVQQYLPEVAREELREAGVQIANASAAKRAKVDAQAATTKQSEIAGSRNTSPGAAPMATSAAFDHAQEEWQRANPGKPFDKVAREQILPRVLQLMTSR